MMLEGKGKKKQTKKQKKEKKKRNPSMTNLLSDSWEYADSLIKNKLKKLP